MENTINLEEQIFLAVLELAPGEDRREFLNKKCGDNHELLARVEQLLDIHQRDDNILDATSGGFWTKGMPAPDSVEVGSQIGAL